MKIQPLKNTLKQSLNEIHQYQTGEKHQIKTCRDWLDTGGGIIPQSIITIAGASFGGKSTELENLKKDIMDINNNPSAGEYVWLSNSLEMTSIATTLRHLKKVLNKPFRDIINQEFTQVEKDKVNEFYKNYTDGRFFINYISPNPTEFKETLEEFIIEHQDKKAIFIDIDHIGLVKAMQDSKKGAVDEIVEALNELKLKYDNCIFVILSQLNRSILGRIEEKSNQSRVRRSDVYMSDTMFHITDYFYALQNAYYLGIEEYLSVNPDKYPHLSHRFTKENAKGRVNFYTSGCIFVEILKNRFAESTDYIDIYTIEISDFEKPKDDIIAKVPTFDNKPKTEMPIFMPNKKTGVPGETITPNKDNDIPF